MHTHTYIQTYRHKDIQTYRHTDIHTYIHTYIYIYATYILTHIIIQYRTHTTGIRVCLQAQTYIGECQGPSMLQHVPPFPVGLCHYAVVLCCPFLGSRHDRSYVLRLTVVIGTFETMATTRPRLPSAVRHSLNELNAMLRLKRWRCYGQQSVTKL